MHARDLRFLRCLRFPLLLADPARYRRPETPARSLLWFGCGRSAALGVLRASAYICVESFIVPRRHRSRDAGRDHQRLRPVAASSVTALIFEGNDAAEGSRKPMPCRCLAEDSWQTAQIFGVSGYRGAHWRSGRMQRWSRMIGVCCTRRAEKNDRLRDRVLWLGETHVTKFSRGLR